MATEQDVSRPAGAPPGRGVDDDAACIAASPFGRCKSRFWLPEVTEKNLFWIAGTTRRRDGYAYFRQHPAQMLEWFDTYMK